MIQNQVVRALCLLEVLVSSVDGEEPKCSIITLFTLFSATPVQRRRPYR